jgi:hypothetical protein
LRVLLARVINANQCHPICQLRFRSVSKPVLPPRSNCAPLLQYQGTLCVFAATGPERRAWHETKFGVCRKYRQNWDITPFGVLEPMQRKAGSYFKVPKTRDLRLLAN